jgi:phage terminase large subunit-like protein
MSIWNSHAQFKVCAAGRRFGKSWLAAQMLLAEAMRLSNDAGYELTSEHAVMYIAPTFAQAKRAIWTKLMKFGGMASKGGLITNFNTNEGWIDLVSGRRIYVTGADNPDSLRGVGLSFVVLDEYADMKAMVWDEIIEPTLMDVDGGALFIGTPKGKNHFYRMFMSASGLGVPGINYDREAWSDWEAFHFKSTDNPFLSQKALNRVTRRSGASADNIRQELDASFIAGGAKVLDPSHFQIVDSVPGLVVRRGGFGATVTTNDARGSVFVTVDPNGFTKTGSKFVATDEMVVAVTYVSDTGDWYVLDMQHGKWDTRESALRIVRALQKSRPCRLGIEIGSLDNAIAPYLEDLMKENSIYVTPEPLRHGNTKKQDRIRWSLQGRLERGKVFLLRGEWNDWLLEQAADFPSPLSNDDGLDAIAYVDQMAVVTYHEAEEDDGSAWAPLDPLAGY